MLSRYMPRWVWMLPGILRSRFFWMRLYGETAIELDDFKRWVSKGDVFCPNCKRIFSAPNQKDSHAESMTLRKLIYDRNGKIKNLELELHKLKAERDKLLSDKAQPYKEAAEHAKRYICMPRV